MEIMINNSGFYSLTCLEINFLLGIPISDETFKKLTLLEPTLTQKGCNNYSKNNQIALTPKG